jgi:hypothetical protein
MNRPLVAVVFAYAAGLVLALIFQPPLGALFAVSFLLLIVVVIVPKLRRFFIWPLLALVGWTNFVAHTAIVSPNDLRALLGHDAALVAARGTLAETPRLKITVRGDEEKWRSVVRVRVGEIGRGNNFQSAAGEILVSTPDVLAAGFFAGQPVEISGVIAPPAPPLAEGLFDFQKYLATRGIYYQLKTDSTNDWKLLDPHRSAPPITDCFLNWSQQTLALGLPAEDEPLRLLWAMTLGWRTAFTGDIGEPFLRAGTINEYLFSAMA